jgi:hypothetical protein
MTTIPLLSNPMPVVEPTPVPVATLPVINISVVGEQPTPEPTTPGLVLAAPGLPVGLVSTPVGVASPTNIGGTVISVPALDEGLSEGFDQGTPEGIDNVDMSPRSLTVDIGIRTPSLQIDPNILGQVGSPGISFAPPQGGSTVSDTPPTTTAPQLQVQAPDLSVVRNIVGAAPPPGEASITDINRYKTSTQTQKMLKYALIAAIAGLVIWYFFFRTGSKSE